MISIRQKTRRPCSSHVRGHKALYTLPDGATRRQQESEFAILPNTLAQLWGGDDTLTRKDTSSHIRTGYIARRPRHQQLPRRATAQVTARHRSIDRWRSGLIPPRPRQLYKPRRRPSMLQRAVSQNVHYRAVSLEPKNKRSRDQQEHNTMGEQWTTTQKSKDEERCIKEEVCFDRLRPLTTLTDRVHTLFR